MRRHALGTLLGSWSLIALACSSSSVVDPGVSGNAAEAGQRSLGGAANTAGVGGTAGESGSTTAGGGLAGASSEAGRAGAIVGGSAGGPAVEAAQDLDTVIFGDTASEAAHAFSETSTQVVVGALGESARQALPRSPPAVNGGDLRFDLQVDPLRRNYVTVKFWGGDGAMANASDMGRLYLYVVQDNVEYQVGYRHEGDYAALNVAASKPALPGRFFYSTTLLPLSMTRGRTRVSLKIVSTGRIYPLGSGVEPTGNYQFLMSAKSRGIYRAYSHTNPLIVTTGERQGQAPVSSTRSAPGEETLSPGGSFFNAVNGRIMGRLSAAASVKSFTTADVAYLARSYSVQGLAGYHNAAVVTQVNAVIDAFASDYYANGAAAVTGGGNEGWGGRYGNLGFAISLLLPELLPTLDTTVDYGAAGEKKTRRAAWSEMLTASRDAGRANRDSFYITNQNILCNISIYSANRGLLALGAASAFSAAAAKRYLEEAIGLAPWLGSDLASGGSSHKFGSNYYQVTRKGLSREWGYVGVSYGEMQWYAANFYAWTGDAEFRDQALKMLGARSHFRRPALEVSGSNYYRTMEGIGLLAWRGAPESDGDFADEVTYGDRTGAGAIGLRVAAVTLDPAAVGYAKQMLADNQYFSTLGNALVAEPSVLDAFDDYRAVKAAPDSNVRLPMTDGQPDFVWSDEEEGVVVIKHGAEKLWLAPYWQAKSGTGINGIARFYFSTPSFDQYGVLETDPEFDYGGTFTRPELTDKPETNFYVPPDNPKQAYAGEKLPLAASELIALPANPNDGSYAPFRGKANFYALRFGHYLVGLNTSVGKLGRLMLPNGSGPPLDLVSGAKPSGALSVSPLTTTALYFEQAFDARPVPTTPLLLVATRATNAELALEWTPASGATRYAVKRAMQPNGIYETVAANVLGSTYTDEKLGAGTTYYYRVSALNDDGESYDSMAARGATAP